MTLASSTSLRNFLTLDVVKEVAATPRNPDESSVESALSVAAQLQMPYPHMTLSLRPLTTRLEQSLVSDNMIRVASITLTTEDDRPRMPYAPMKHMLASPNRSEQPRMPYAPMTVPPPSPTRRYGSPKNSYASMNPDMAPSVCSFGQPRVSCAQRNVALVEGVQHFLSSSAGFHILQGNPLK